MLRFTALLATLIGGLSQNCDPGTTWDGTRCVSDRTCSGATPYKYGNNCYDSCPAGTYAYFSDCMTTCPDGTVTNGTNCEKQTTSCNTNQYLGPDNICRDNPSCSSTQYLGSDYKCHDYPNYNYTVSCGSNQYMNSNGTCVDYVTCGSNQYLGSDGVCHDYQNSCPYWYNNTCVTACPKGTLTTAWNTCVEACPDYMFRNGTACVFRCEGGVGYNGTCLTHCPREAPIKFYDKCVDSCPTGWYDMGNGLCEYGCSGFYLADKCVDRCPSGMVILYDKHCMERCPGDMIQNGTRCESRCPPGQYFMNGVCYDYGYTGNWTNGCGVNQYMDAAGKCVDYYNGNYTWTNPCPSGQYQNADGKCVDYNGNWTWTNPCAADQWYWNNTCVTACKPDEFLDMTGHCMNPADMCRREMPGAVFNNTSYQCECPTGSWITRNPNATDVTKPIMCAPAPAGAPRINCRSFIPYTVFDMTMNTCVCDADHPVVVANPKDPFVPYGCAVAGTSTTIKQCPRPAYFDFIEGECTRLDSVNNATGPNCAGDMIATSTGGCQCPEGTTMTDYGRCMSPADMCAQELAGGIWYADRKTCACPAGSWMTRNDIATPMAKCAPVPSTVISTVDKLPKIDCLSFVVHTIFDFDIGTCRCVDEFPVVVSVTDAKGIPFACAPLGTTSTVKPCSTSQFFDFGRGVCVDYTPLPTKTSTATRTALPSRKPSTTPTPTRTAKPSDIPNSATSTPSASRTPKPSARIYADISRAPLPSVAVRPPPPAAALSPAPSPWAKKVNLVLEAVDRPPYIDARMTLAGGNATTLAKPEKIQQLQASLACALRMPLENIRIRNITVTDAAGVTKRVDVDPSQFMMAGDGSTNCYDLRNVSAAARRLRALGASGSGSVSVDYAIVEPSDDILSLDTTQFNEVVSTSPILIDMASSVGSTGVTAAAVEANMVTAPVPSAAASPSAGATLGPQYADIRYYIGGGIGGLAVFAGLVTAMVFMYKENRRTKRLLREERARKMATAPVPENPRVVVMFSGEPQTVNPMGRAGMMRAESTRLDYGPEAARRSVAGPLRQTHGTVV